MTNKLILLAVFTVTVALVIIFQARRLPADAKRCGDHWLKCYSVNQGLYSCKIYGKDKKLIKEQAYMLPYKHWRRNQRELTGMVEKYDGDTIYLGKGMKLLACDVPYEAKMIPSIVGLVWVKYDAVDERRNMYFCETYSTKDGSIASSGAYILKKYHWDENRNKTVYQDVKDPVRFFDLNYYGGISITLNNKMALMPADTIEYNAGPYSGLRVKYDKEGNELEREEF